MNAHIVCGSGRSRGMRAGRGVVRLALPLLLLACLSGCNYKFNVEQSVTMYKDYAVRIPSVFTPGTPIPDKYSKMDVPVCTIPDEEAMWAMVKERLGSFGNLAQKMYAIETIDLLESRMTATVGSFETLTFVKLDFKPVTAEGESQQILELGMVSSEQGLGTEIVLVPPEPVELVQIMRDAQANTAGECPLVAAEVHGLVPTPPVAADVAVRVNVTVRAKGFFASIIGWFAHFFI